MDNKQTLNQDVLDKYGPALKAILGQLVTAGFNDIQAQLNALNELSGETDKEVMVRAAHSIKSCSAQLGGELLSSYAAEKEQQYIADDLASLIEDINEFTIMFGALKNEMERVIVERGIK